MKKIITICLFAFAMVLGTQTVAAQSKVEINSIASKKTQELKKAIKFNSDTEDKVYQTYQMYEQKMANLEKIIASGETVADEDKEKINNMLNDKFRTIFTPEQYKLYLEYADQQK